jgi:hypothetical protein
MHARASCAVWPFPRPITVRALRAWSDLFRFELIDVVRNVLTLEKLIHSEASLGVSGGERIGGARKPTKSRLISPDQSLLRDVVAPPVNIAKLSF